MSTFVKFGNLLQSEAKASFAGSNPQPIRRYCLCSLSKFWKRLHDKDTEFLSLVFLILSKISQTNWSGKPSITQSPYFPLRPTKGLTKHLKSYSKRTSMIISKSNSTNKIRTFKFQLMWLLKVQTLIYPNARNKKKMEIYREKIGVVSATENRKLETDNLIRFWVPISLGSNFETANSLWYSKTRNLKIEEMVPGIREDWKTWKRRNDMILSKKQVFEIWRRYFLVFFLGKRQKIIKIIIMAIIYLKNEDNFFYLLNE